MRESDKKMKRKVKEETKERREEYKIAEERS